MCKKFFSQYIIFSVFLIIILLSLDTAFIVMFTNINFNDITLIHVIYELFIKSILVLPFVYIILKQEEEKETLTECISELEDIIEKNGTEIEKEK